MLSIRVDFLAQNVTSRWKEGRKERSQPRPAPKAAFLDQPVGTAFSDQHVSADVPRWVHGVGEELGVRGCSTGAVGWRGGYLGVLWWEAAVGCAKEEPDLLARIVQPFARWSQVLTLLAFC